MKVLNLWRIVHWPGFVSITYSWFELIFSVESRFLNRLRVVISLLTEAMSPGQRKEWMVEILMPLIAMRPL
jgi:hypothetical protein